MMRYYKQPLKTNRRVYDEPQEVSSSYSMDSNSEYFGEITVSENHIYLYRGISPKSVMEMGIAIKSVGQQIINMATDLGLPSVPPIHLHINSGGGCAFSGLAGAGHILGSEIPVYTYVEGSAASAATIMSCVGAQRFITEHSFMLIHQISTGVWGTYENLVDEKESMDALMAQLESIYLKNTKMKKKDLKDLLSRDLWMNAEMCLQKGLVDEIIKYERV
jgi:ATP-dependent protease ClpP protease subunit